MVPVTGEYSPVTHAHLGDSELEPLGGYTAPRSGVGLLAWVACASGQVRSGPELSGLIATSGGAMLGPGVGRRTTEGDILRSLIGRLHRGNWTHKNREGRNLARKRV